MNSTLLLVISHAWVHFVIDLANLFTDHKMSGSANSCQVQAFKDNLWASLWQFSQLIPVPPFWTDGRPSKDEKLCKVAPHSCLPIHSIAQRIFEHVLPCCGTTLLFVREIMCHPGHFSVAPAEVRDSNIFVYCSMSASWGLHSLWVHPKNTWSRNDVGSSISTFFINVPPHGNQMLLLSSYLNVIHMYWQKNKPCSRWTNIHSQFGIFSHPSSK